MSRRNPNEEKKIELAGLIDTYKAGKDLENKYKKDNTALNTSIKDIFLDLFKDKLNADGEAEFSTEQFTAKLKVKKNEELNEAKAIETIKSEWASKNGSMTCPYLKMVYVLDEEAIEKAIYNGELKAEVLASCKEVKEPTYTLTVGKLKK